MQDYCDFGIDSSNHLARSHPVDEILKNDIWTVFKKFSFLFFQNNANVLKILQLQEPLKSSKTNRDLYLCLDLYLHVNNILIYPVAWSL